jgi:hypothetical protein
MRKTSTVELQSKTFRITQLSFQNGRKVLLRMSRVLAPLLAARGSSNESEIVEALSSALSNTSDEDLAFYTEKFGECCEYVQDGDKARRMNREDVQDELFAGNYSLYLLWLKECAVCNFSDFFGGSGHV